MTNTKGWGGVRANSGRKKSTSPKKTVVIRIDENLLPIIKEIKQKYQQGQGIESLLPVTNNQEETLTTQPSHQIIDLLQENKQLKKQNNQLSIKRNEEHIKATEFKNQQDNLQKVNLDLVLQRDTEHGKVIELEGKCRSLKADLKTKDTGLERLKHLEHNCQMLTNAGNRCTKPAKLKLLWQGVEINVCLQHSKTK